MHKNHTLPLLPYSEINLIDGQISYLSRCNERIRFSSEPDNEQFRKNAETIILLRQAEAKLTAERTAARKAEQKRRDRRELMTDVVMSIIFLALGAIACVTFKTLP